ncbi:MAG: polysaccharide biosynthesis tyrosine autokinase [Bacillota bacterium]|nr:polysaccharide biosynthesis tyrosine autokinase [Bacillota bacterium]MDW7676557.1 polysaccharide biosynthesis tyrosine autokinase [Bacillota bacterium]
MQPENQPQAPPTQPYFQNPAYEYDEQELDLREILNLLRVRWWVIALIFLLAVGAAFYVSTQVLTPIYRAETSLFVGKEDNRVGPINVGDLNLGQSLVTDYREIILSRLVAREVLDDLNLNMPITAFRSQVGVATVRDSRMFTISFESADPRQAMDVANALGSVIIDKAAEIIEIRNVQVIDAAELPMIPVKPNILLNIAIAGVLGLMLGVFLVFMLEYLDRTIKSDKDIERHLQIPLLAGIPVFKGEKRGKNGSNRKKKTAAAVETDEKSSPYGNGVFSKTLISLHDPKNPASEAFRALRTGIRYSSVDDPIKTVVVTSAGPMDGKSTVTVNLAVAMAQIGKRVLVIEADLRKPKLHHHFDLVNDMGLSDYIVGHSLLPQVIKPVKGIENLHVITSGPLPPHSSVILESQKMQHMLDSLQRSYDYIIIDTPPVGQITDAAILARYAQGTVLVLAAGETHIEMAKLAMKSLRQVNANMLGAVLTKISKKTTGAYYYRYHQYNEYYAD